MSSQLNLPSIVSDDTSSSILTPVKWVGQSSSLPNVAVPDTSCALTYHYEITVPPSVPFCLDVRIHLFLLSNELYHLHCSSILHKRCYDLYDTRVEGYLDRVLRYDENSMTFLLRNLDFATSVRYALITIPYIPDYTVILTDAAVGRIGPKTPYQRPMMLELDAMVRIGNTLYAGRPVLPQPLEDAPLAHKKIFALVEITYGERDDAAKGESSINKVRCSCPTIMPLVVSP